MLKEERQKYILDQVHLHNRVLLTDLSEHLSVSIDTVRRDVKELDKEKKLRKVHGGATSIGFLTASPNDASIYLHGKKIVIAEKAVQLIREGMVLLMSGGTTNLEVVKLFPRKLQFTVITPSLHVALQLMEFPLIEVIFLGGKLMHDAKFAIGGTVIHALRDIRADLCFLGTGYVDPRHGLTEFDWEVVQVKRAMLQSARQTVLLTVSDKLYSVQRYKTCALDEVHTLITELSPQDPLLRDFQGLALQLL
ncbi:MAG: DeoR/GlpR family DNA-binding transcription regulator [Nitritalea sp.]